MKKIKKALRLSGLAALILLSSIGIGLMGGIPVRPNGRREDTIEVKVELPEKDENTADEHLFQFKR